jgi:hypothetical protein
VTSYFSDGEKEYKERVYREQVVELLHSILSELRQLNGKKA